LGDGRRHGTVRGVTPKAAILLHCWNGHELPTLPQEEEGKAHMQPMPFGRVEIQDSKTI